MATRALNNLGLTALRHQFGRFDLLVDYGTFDDLSASARDRHLEQVLPLAAPAARFLLLCFQWPPRRVDRWLGLRPVSEPEIQHRFGGHFAIERVAGSDHPRRRAMVPGFAAYLMTRC
ncbi:MAG TPA: hypothetical protein VF163_20310 [Micromonosporaceae bacterium]